MPKDRRRAVLIGLYDAEHDLAIRQPEFIRLGAGGSLGFANPEAGIGYAYVTSQMGTRLTGDPRDMALRNALYSAIRSPTTGDRVPA
jgi:CubicO group peptidase (beta-lactamase class C family)